MSCLLLQFYNNFYVWDIIVKVWQIDVDLFEQWLRYFEVWIHQVWLLRPIYFLYVMFTPFLCASPAQYSYFFFFLANLKLAGIHVWICRANLMLVAHSRRDTCYIWLLAACSSKTWEQSRATVLVLHGGYFYFLTLPSWYAEQGRLVR